MRLRILALLLMNNAARTIRLRFSLLFFSVLSYPPRRPETREPTYEGFEDDEGEVNSHKIKQCHFAPPLSSFALNGRDHLAPC